MSNFQLDNLAEVKRKLNMLQELEEATHLARISIWEMDPIVATVNIIIATNFKLELVRWLDLDGLLARLGILYVPGSSFHWMYRGYLMETLVKWHGWESMKGNQHIWAAAGLVQCYNALFYYLQHQFQNWFFLIQNSS